MNARIGTTLFWLVAGVMHFARPKFYEPIVPPPLDRYRREVVALSGVAELLGAATVLPGPTRRFARWWLLLTLAAIYPANIYMALNPERFKAVPEPLLWGRLPLQFVMAWFTWRGTE